MKKCKYCQSEMGVYTKLAAWQFYDFSGNPQGVDVGVETKSVYCQNCNRRIGTLSQIEKGAKPLGQTHRMEKRSRSTR